MLRVVFNAVRRIFPKVEHLDTDTLERWMKDEDKDNLVLLVILTDKFLAYSVK